MTKWQTSSLTNMGGMFSGAESFVGNISTWDVSNVYSMYGTFRDATKFNSDLNTWDVSSVTSMNSLFYNAISFNGSLSNWQLSTIGMNADNMFNNASAFNQELCGWGDTFPYDSTDVFVNSGCEYQDDPQMDMQGPFCGSDCVPTTSPTSIPTNLPTKSPSSPTTVSPTTASPTAASPTAASSTQTSKPPSSPQVVRIISDHIICVACEMSRLSYSLYVSLSIVIRHFSITQFVIIISATSTFCTLGYWRTDRSRCGRESKIDWAEYNDLISSM